MMNKERKNEEKKNEKKMGKRMRWDSVKIKDLGFILLYGI